MVLRSWIRSTDRGVGMAFEELLPWNEENILERLRSEAKRLRVPFAFFVRFMITDTAKMRTSMKEAGVPLEYHEWAIKNLIRLVAADVVKASQSVVRRSRV